MPSLNGPVVGSSTIAKAVASFAPNVVMPRSASECPHARTWSPHTYVVVPVPASVTSPYEIAAAKLPPGSGR